MATLFTPLSARYTLPSEVATMLRTTPPPEGIGVLENFFVRGSNLTNVFGSMPDSLNQTVPSGVTAIPYGLAPAPPGEGHSSTFREAGLKSAELAARVVAVEDRAVWGDGKPARSSAVG